MVFVLFSWFFFLLSTPLFFLSFLQISTTGIQILTFSRWVQLHYSLLHLYIHKKKAWCQWNHIKENILSERDTYLQKLIHSCMISLCNLFPLCFVKQVRLDAQAGWFYLASPKASLTNTWKRNNLFKVHWNHRSFVIGEDLSRNVLV